MRLRQLIPFGLVLGLTTPAFATVDLVDGSGLTYYINDDVTYSSSSASGAASEASYTQAVPTTTTSGATTSSTLGDAFDGYNGVIIDGTTYTNNGDATLECKGRDVVLNPQTIGDLTVSRRVYVPDNDAFARWITFVTNNGTKDATVTMEVVNNLGSDGSTEILGSESGDTKGDTTDHWVATGGDYDDPRLAHVLGNRDGAISANVVTFTDGDDNPEWSYEFTVGAGETRAIMNLVSGVPTNPEAVAKAAELVALPPNVFQCMTQEQWDQIANFGVDCTAVDDACNMGNYSVATGMCEPMAANEGGMCDDGDKCTVNDVCDAGVCAGTKDPDICDPDEKKKPDPTEEPEPEPEPIDSETGCGCSSASPAGAGLGALLLLGLVSTRRRH